MKESRQKIGVLTREVRGKLRGSLVPLMNRMCSVPRDAVELQQEGA